MSNPALQSFLENVATNCETVDGEIVSTRDIDHFIEICTDEDLDDIGTLKEQLDEEFDGDLEEGAEVGSEIIQLIIDRTSGF